MRFYVRLRLGGSIGAIWAAGAAGACGGDSGTDTGDAGAGSTDAVADAPVDATSDATRTGDSGADAGADVGVDAASDGPTDGHVALVPPCTRAADAGAPAVYIAPKTPDMTMLPQVTSVAGVSLHHPTFIAVTFSGDPYADAIDDFVASVGCTDYWRSIVGDYGVGDAVALPPVHLSEAPPANIDDPGVRAWVEQRIADGTLPPPPQDAVYIVFYPAGTTITLFGETSCQSFGGYHESATAGGLPVAYAVLARCPVWHLKDLAMVTSIGSHELIEAVSDPQPEAPGAYPHTDANHPGWLLDGNEIGDMCERSPGSFYQPKGYPWFVQRGWSNSSAYAGADPCVPAASKDFVWGPPQLPDQTQMDLGQGPTNVPVVHIAVGANETIPVVLAGSSQAAVPVDAVDWATVVMGTPTLQLSLDKTQGSPGDTLQLTITKKSASANGYEPFAVVTTNAGNPTYFWALTTD
jgi:hypothetical protein